MIKTRLFHVVKYYLGNQHFANVVTGDASRNSSFYSCAVFNGPLRASVQGDDQLIRTRTTVEGDKDIIR